jgi:hypothetical protein
MSSHFYILYKIINKINGRFYIGVHKTKDIHDDYYGSGLLIKRAIEKYGIENFSKEILQVFSNQAEAFKKEKELVTDALVKDNMCYNIKEGGRGGFDHIRAMGLGASNTGKKIIHNIETGQQIPVKIEDLESYINNGWKLGFSPNSLKKMSESGKKKIQSKEHCKKNSESKKDSFLLKSPDTGKCKFVKKEFVNEFLAKGWFFFYKRQYERFTKNII